MIDTLPLREYNFRNPAFKSQSKTLKLLVLKVSLLLLSCRLRYWPSYSVRAHSRFFLFFPYRFLFSISFLIYFLDEITYQIFLGDFRTKVSFLKQTSV